MLLPLTYEDPHERGVLGGVEPFATAHQLKTPQAKRILQSVLSYTLHKPRRNHFPTTPTRCLKKTSNGRWIWWTCKKWNKGNKYLLTVIDALSKYAWAVPIKSKSPQEMIRGFEGIRRQASPRQPLGVQTYQGK